MKDFPGVLQVYFEYSGLMKMSVQLMDNVLGENH